MKVHAQTITSTLLRDPRSGNHLASLYSNRGFSGHAQKLADANPERDLVVRSALISSYVQNGAFREAIVTFREMHMLDVKCNEFTYPSVLKACSMRKGFVMGKQVQGNTAQTGFESDVYVCNTLVVLYAKCWEFRDCRRLFDMILKRNVVSWNALLACYVQSNFHGDAVELFREMLMSGKWP